MDIKKCTIPFKNNFWKNTLVYYVSKNRLKELIHVLLNWKVDYEKRRPQKGKERT